MLWGERVSPPSAEGGGSSSFPSRKGPARGGSSRRYLGPGELDPPAVQFKVVALWFREPELVLFYGD